jgi:hypothetical protein
VVRQRTGRSRRGDGERRKGRERILVEKFVWRMKRLVPKDLIYEIFQHAGILWMHGQPGREETRTKP